MVACLADAGVLFLPCGFFFLLSFFLAYSQPSHIGCLPYFHTWCGLTADLECRCETCCTWLAENTGCKNGQKVAIWAPSHNFVGLYISSQLRHVLTVGKKLVKQQYLLICPHSMLNFGTLAADICKVVWGTPANFNGFRSWQRYCTVLQQWASAALGGVEHKGRHLYSTGRPSR